MAVFLQMQEHLMSPFSRTLAETLVAALWADGAVQDSERSYLRKKFESLGVTGARSRPPWRSRVRQEP